MASKRLRRRALKLAQPQVQAARRQGHREVSALGSEGRALQQNISRARHDFRRIPGLTGRDQRIALENVAQQRIEAAGGIASQQSAAHADTRGTISDIRQQAVSDLVQQQAANAHDAAMARLSGQIAAKAAAQGERYDVRNTRLASALDLKNSLLEALTSPSSSTGKGGLTPYEKRGVRHDRQNALGLVRSAYQASLSGASGAPAAPRSDAEWQHWGDLLYQRYHTTVDRGDIAHAIQRIRNKQLQHVGDNPVLKTLASLFH